MEIKLTIKDLIVEFLVCKAKYGYEPSFTKEEFSEFINYIKQYYKIEDLPSDINTKNICIPHIETTEKGIVIPTNDLSKVDMEQLNTFSIPMKEKDKIHFMIQLFLAGNPRRNIDMYSEINDNDLLLGKYTIANIILAIWNSCLKRNRYDINNWLLNEPNQNNLLKREFVNFYQTSSKKVTILNKTVNDIKISNNENIFLPYSNYLLIMQDFNYLARLLSSQEILIDINRNSINLNNKKENIIDNSAAKRLVRALNEK